MRVGIETIVQTILLCISCMVLAQMIGANLYMLQARTCFHMLANQIEYSQNSESVIEQCKEEAMRQGYRLESQQISAGEEDSCILLSLYYEVKIPGLTGSGEEKTSEGVIQGYAR